MDCNMKRFITIASICILALASCIGPHETDFDFILDRDECRFAADSGQSYFRVFGEGRWTAAFEQEVDWVSLDKMEGMGESQILVFHKKNEGLSRGVNLFIDHEDGTRKTIYMSQKSGLGSDKPAYSLNTGNLKLLSLGMDIKVLAVSNISPEAVDSASVKTIYAGADSSWISGITITPEDVSLSVSPNETGVERSAKIQFAFNGAVWDEPYTVFLNIVQGGAGPEISLAESYELDPLGTKTLEISAGTNWDPGLYSYDLSDFSISDESFLRSVEYVDSTATLKVLPSMNKTKDARNTTLTWKAKDYDGNVVSTASATLSQPVSAIQLDGDPVNLTEGGKYANCYILPQAEATYYSLEPKLVSGVLPSENIADAKLLWQTAENVLEYVAYSPMEGIIYIYKPEGVKGSAIVALTDKDGKIVWSLHFWASGEAVGECTIGGYTFMDRNIGAISTTAPVNGENDAAGMHYQWGRKDPFPPAKILKQEKYYKNPTDTKEAATGQNRQIVYPDIISATTAQDGVELNETIANPNIYYWGKSNDSGEENWCSPVDDELWSTSAKTNYDPCPYGYVVPSKEQLEAAAAKFTTDDTNGYYATCDNESKNFWCKAGQYRRQKNDYCELANVTTSYYWSSTIGEFKNNKNEMHRGSYVMEKKSVKVNPRRWGANIRCVKANNQ